MVSCMNAIRKVALFDLPGVYRVCLETGASGQDATDLYANPDLLGHVYAGAYVVHSPQFGFVIDGDQGIGGYILATGDTEAFESWAEGHWWPALQRHYPLAAPSAAAADDDGAAPATRDANLIRTIHNPGRTPAEVTETYPAHLHVDLLPRMQGSGLGRALMDRLIAELRDAGVPGLHLCVAADNTNAIEFYRHLGFEQILEGHGSLYLAMAL